MALVAAILLTACAETTVVGGDAGCDSYAEARLTMPDDLEALPTNWLEWIAKTDARMTGTCRG